MRPLTTVLCGALLVLCGCGTSADVQPTDGSSTSSLAETSTGMETGAGVDLCELELEPDSEALDPDPEGCYDIQDEPTCVAQTDKCMGLYGVPASYNCESSAWCIADPNSPTFLGCRPTTICKRRSKMVCTRTGSGVEAFWTDACVPKEFGECQPMFIAEDSMQPPASCE